MAGIGARALVIGTVLAIASSAWPAQISGTVIEPSGPVIKLDDVGIYTIGCKYRSGVEKQFPIGWTGNFDDATGVACMPFGEQNGMQATLLHCPWRGGTGISYQEFRFRVPRVAKATVTGAIALGSYAVGKSDGATFRVFANGTRLLDENRRNDTWKEFSFDVTKFTGGVLTLRFETDPGPRDNASFDYSLWGDRRLVLAGVPEMAQRTAPMPAPDLLAASAFTKDVAPQDGEKGTAALLVQGDTRVFRWTGATGRMEYRWRFPVAATDPPIGTVILKSSTVTDGVAHTVETPLAASASIAWTADAHVGGAKPIPADGGFGFERTYQVGATTAHLRVIGRLVAKSLIFEVSCDKPVVRELNIGGWGPVAYRRNVTTPYYSGQVLYLPLQNLFVNAFLDWTRSGASSNDGPRAVYGALTDESRNLLNERAVYSASWHLAGALPSIPNPKSPFIGTVGGRLVLDTWGGSFDDIAKGFAALHDYGIDDCTAIIHDWQRSGYDNALPAHFPANANLGGEEAMKSLVQTGKRLGYLVALHENYVDYYPNYEGFRDSDIALDSDGKRELAWYQPGTKIQSFAIKPNAILQLAKTQSPEIHRRYGTNADYLDVHSAVPPWFHVDYRAGEVGAGTFHQVWDTHRRLWAYERETHQGPVFGEGANHWYWSGLLDGAEAQFGVGWPGSQGMAAPLMVDFDLLRIHPLQANHGMGYYERWWSGSPWQGLPPMSVLDQYRMQEVAYGHTGFLSGSTWNQLPYAWLEDHLLAPVTAAYAGVPPKRIEYQVYMNWVDADQAAKEGKWDRVRVTYANGLVVTANSRQESLNVGGQILPQFGWSAKGAGVTAWTAVVKGAYADYAEAPDRVFANARREANWNVSGIRQIRPEAVDFKQTGDRRFRLTYRWRVGESLDRDYIAFVHFFTHGAELNQEGIRFQGDHSPRIPTSKWTPYTTVDDGPWDVTVPEGVADGMYELGVGLYRVNENRVALSGHADPHGRIILGTITVHDSGRTIYFFPDRGGPRIRDKYKEDLNPGSTVIDFGTLRTNGSVNIVRKGDEWVMQTFPRNQAFELELSAKRFGAPKEVACIGVKSMPFRPVVKDGYWRMELNSATEYRWPAKP